LTEVDQVGRRPLEPVNPGSSSGLSLQLRWNRRSDNRKFPFALERADTGSFVGMGIETATAAGTFQADDEGSIPFTRSTHYQRFPRNPNNLSKNSGLCRVSGPESV